MTVSQLAKTAGVRPETVRYYQRIGLMRTPPREEHSFRSYDNEDATRLRFIRHGQSLGFTLDDIAELLHLSTTDCEEAERLAKARLVNVRTKIESLRKLEKALEDSVVACEQRTYVAGCPLIEALLA
jgi:MerR family mercuric resistance operon transcriptional regulator